MNKIKIASIFGVAGILIGGVGMNYKIQQNLENNVSSSLQDDGILADRMSIAVTNDFDNSSYLKQCEEHDGCLYIGSIRSDWYKTVLPVDQPVISKTLEVMNTNSCPYVTIAEALDVNVNPDGKGWSSVEGAIRLLRNDYDTVIFSGEYMSETGSGQAKAGTVDIYCTQVPKRLAVG